MFNDSDSPQNDYNSLLSWVDSPQTQAALRVLEEEADGLKEILVNLPPSRDLGQVVGGLLHREQSFGEIRGLQRLNKLISDRRTELEIKLGLKKPNLLEYQE